MTTPQQLRITTREATALASAAMLTVAGDYLFWRSSPGISLGIYALLAAVALILKARAISNRYVWIALGLLSATAVQTGIEQSFSNIVVLALLTIALVGESEFHVLRAHPHRWAEGILALCNLIAGWLWLASTARSVPVERRLITRVADALLRVLLPAVGLAIVFALLIAAGNAVVGDWISRAFSAVIPWLTQFDISFGRILLCVVLSTFALTLLRPKTMPGVERKWMRAIPEFAAPPNSAIAFWRTTAILALLNALFFAADTADVLYLWRTTQLPATVTYSAFVHHGVYSLIAAVVLSAVVLVALFQQAPIVRSTKTVRVLGLSWIAQNLVLIAGVLLRLLRYVEAYQLSELRVYVGCFLLLVTIGFCLLTIHILAEKGFSWLLFTNALATFVLFFALQFPDVAKWVAEDNVARWQNDSRRVLDVCYLAKLGPSAVDSLISVAETPNRTESHVAFEALQAQKPAAQEFLAHLDWRSWQSRKVRGARLLTSHEVRTRR